MKLRTSVLSVVGVCAAVVASWPLVFAAPPAKTANTIVLDEAGVIADREFWNRAVRAAHAQKWDELVPLLAANERAEWHEPLRGSKEEKHVELFTKMFFPEEINANNALVQSYRQSDGQTLTRIYREVRRDYWGRVGVHRLLWGTIAGDEHGRKSLHCGFDAPDQFGIGQPVAGIRLDVHAAKTTIDTWKQFEMVFTFTNTTKSETIKIPSSPYFRLQLDLGIGLIAAATPENQKAFNDWYREVWMASEVSVSGLSESMEHDHRPASLKPGESREYIVKLADVCWNADHIPDGPAGTFRLFVTFDPNLEWDPFEAIVPAWRHRIASSEFTVTVGR